MKTTYTLALSDGKKVTVEDVSAGAAIEKARWTYRGRLIVSCYSGHVTAHQDHSTPQVWQPAYIEYEIPEHSAVSEDAVQPAPRMRRAEDTTSIMSFFEDCKTVKPDSGKG